MPINASLFAHIQNDAFLKGTYSLEGNLFSTTSGYLREYLHFLKSQPQSGIPYNPKYDVVLKELDYSIQVEQEINAAPAAEAQASPYINDIAERIAQDLEYLAQGEQLTLPGGWTDLEGGHAMIYQFIREGDHYVLKVINAGDGIGYHSKKSIAEKELYNPVKAWSIPLSQTPKDKVELAQFISRLLKTRVLTTLVDAMSAKKLYEEVLPSISYIGGTEIEADGFTPEFAYTAGQLSGTCSQRSIHQMLKINSDSLLEYRQFIFKFKMHSLEEYAELCLNGAQPFNAAVAAQIRLAIENNLKILNTQALFNDIETEKYVNELEKIATEINQHPILAAQVVDPVEYFPDLLVSGKDLQAPRVLPDRYDFSIAAAITIDFSTGDFLTKLTGYLDEIRFIKDPATRYIYLEQLILALPLTQQGTFNVHPYTGIVTLANYERFFAEIGRMQSLIHNLQKNWAKDAQLTKLNTLALNALTLRTDAYNVISEKKRLPSYKIFTDLTIGSMVGNQTKNPFWATNHPKLDDRIHILQDRFKSSPIKYKQSFVTYFQDLLRTDQVLRQDLDELYRTTYGLNNEEVHKNVRDNNLQALYMIHRHIKNLTHLDARFNPLIQKVEEFLAYEAELRRYINPFYQVQYSENSYLDIAMYGTEFRLSTPLYPTYVPFERLSQEVIKHKYNLVAPSPAKDALEQDSSEKSTYNQEITTRTANHIQLHPGKGGKEEGDQSRTITQDDIVAREYHHLRSNPKLQIALTLDYFKRNIHKLSDEPNQRYLEANLFQTGLLLDEIKKESFLPQFDSFLATGLRFFTKSGQHTRNSILFLRLNVLVSGYMALNGNRIGIDRLTSIQEDIFKQLELAKDPDIIYVLQQYMFLATMKKIASEGPSAKDLELALNAYIYIQGHTNPSILEDSNHKAEVETAIASFQALMNKERYSMDALIERAILNENNPKTAGLRLRGYFPEYRLVDQAQRTIYQFNAILGKIFENNLARSGIPLPIKNHPLLKRLGLDHLNECFMSADQTYMVLPNPPSDTELFYKDDKLTVRQNWSVNGIKQKYELQAISYDHLARHANTGTYSAYSVLPETLQDGSIDYWKSTTIAGNGLLVKNNVPRYVVNNEREIILLNDEGLETEYQLKPLNVNWAHQLTGFEGSKFMHHHKGPLSSHVELPRFNLRFDLSGNKLTLSDTKEEIVEGPSPIHAKVAGLIVSKDEHERYLVPIARFYATRAGAVESDFYPVVHDIDGTVAKATLEQAWKLKPPAQKPLWRHENSAQFASFQLKDGKPIADTAADALYLAYIYLSTNETQKAWDTLEDCKTRLGGLTGSADELKYISWISNSLPHILPGQEKDTKKAIRKTPPYVACKLKALSLACDYLSQDKRFDLQDRSNPNDTSANAQFKMIELAAAKRFLQELPEKIYQDFSRLQNMRRHLEGTYTLSTIERKRLLNYYQQSQPTEESPKGALGHEWMQLNLEALQDERRALLALKDTGALSEVDQQRLVQIDAHFKKLKPVLAKSTQLKLVPINLEIPIGHELNQSALPQATKDILSSWINKLPGDLKGGVERETAIRALSSNISKEQLITYFPVYLQIAKSNDVAQRKALNDFCTKVLLANRHISIANQESNLSFFCNILYRVLCNSPFALSNNLGQEYSLNQLVTAVRGFGVTPLQVYEAQDVYQRILTKPEELLEQQKPVVLAVQKPRSDYTPLIASITDGSALDQLLKKHNALNQVLEQANAQLIETLKVHPEQSIDIEEQAGKNQLKFEQDLRALAEELANSPNAIVQVKQLIHDKLPVIEDLKDNLWKEALQLANQGPDDPKLNRQWRIERAAKARPMLNEADLCSLYTHADLNYIIERTGLSEANAQGLHAIIHNALVYGIQYKMLTNIKDGLEKSEKTGKSISLVPVLDLLARKEIPALDEPAIILLQHEEEIVLRPRQISALKHLLEHPEQGKPFRESVEKIIPGGGKSKVILPILAEQKARGDNLVIVEVPQALLATNHVDLNQISQRLFGKAAYRFEFNRDSNSSAARLEQLFNQFTEIMTTRGYLVTAGESIQSLELKYLELLLSEEEHDEEWEKQIFWCDKIVNLIHHHGDAVIDEVHQGLWIKKKLNYTVGSPKPIAPSTIQNAIALFHYIDSDFVKEAPSLGEDFDWDGYKKNLATKLITDKNSPLSTFITRAKKQYGLEVEAELIAYILNQAKTQCDAIRNAPAEIKSALAFFKQEVSVLLPQTLGRRLDEKYGASKRPNLNPIEQTLAIPYAANNIPNERSRFGNNLEAINCTCQMLLIKGISKELMIERLSLLQSAASQETFQNPGIKGLDQSPTAQGFAIRWKKLNLQLSEINLKDDAQMTRLHALLEHDRGMIFEILEQQSLKLINRESGIIHSDSFNHVDLYRTVQAVSGTPSNHTTFHERLEYDQTSSLGTDGYIIELLHSKDTQIANIDYKNATQFISSIFTNSTEQDRCRAIIDIRAAFQGVSNIEVAREIAKYISENAANFNKEIKHVLYFNEDQVLCAIDVNKPNISIILKSSDVDEVNRILGTTPDERFTYYDQVRTLGTDITQDENAHALVLVDEKTSLQSFLQGSMRMRGISQNQTIELVTPQSLAGVNRTNLIKQFEKADQRTLLMDNLFAAKGMMTNLARRSCLDLVQELPSELAHDKAELAKKMKAFFVSNPSNDLFELYGALSSKQLTKDILERYQKHILTLLTNAMQSADLELSEEHEQRIKEGLQRIIDKALPNCTPEYEGNQENLAVEVEVQKEVQKEVETQVMRINQQYEPTLKEASPVAWKNYYSIDSLCDYYLPSVSFSLNSMCSPAKAPDSVTLFSKELLVSKSYAQTHTTQKEYIDAFLKPVHLVWYRRDFNGKLHAMVITPEDAEGLKDQINPTRGNWITTTENTVVCGTRPDGMLENPDYQSLQEQVRFFNGELNSFLTPDASLCWLTDKPVEKINFFEERLLTFRPEASAKFQELRKALTESNTEGYDYITAHCFEDLSDFEWISLGQDTSQAQISDYQRVANAFNYMNFNWQNEVITIEALQQQFRVSVKSLSYVNDHLTYLNGINSIIDRHAILLTGEKAELYPAEKRALEKCLGMKFDVFCQQLDAISPPKATEELINCSILITLNNFPALQRRGKLNEVITNIARITTSAKVLNALLKGINKPTLGLIEEVMENQNRDASTLSAVLSVPGTLTPITLARLARECNEEQVKLLIKKDGITDSVLNLVLEKPISGELLLEIIPYAISPRLLEIIYLHEHSNPSVRALIHKNNLFNDVLLLSIVKNHTLNEEELAGLLNEDNKAVNDKVLLAIASNEAYSSDLLLQVVSHVKAGPSTRDKALRHPKISPKVLQKILDADPAYIQQDTILAIATIACLKISQGQLIDPLWEDIALQAFKKAVTIGKQISVLGASKIVPRVIGTIGAKETLLEKPTFALEILKIFGRQVVEKLPISHMIKTVNEAQLQTLIDPQFTGYGLRDAELILLCAQCATKKQIDLLLTRGDLDADCLLQVLSKKGLTDEQLLSIIRLSKDDRVLERVYFYPEIKETIKQKIFEHPQFSSYTISSLLKKQMKKEDLTYLLKNKPSLFEPETLSEVVDSFYDDENILIEVLLHKNTTEKLILDILKVYFATATAYQKILEQSLEKTITKTNLTRLLVVMAKNIFYSVENTYQPEEYKAWEECAIAVFNHALLVNASTPIVNLIRESQRSLPPRVALRALDVFGTRIIDRLEIPAVAAVAGDKELPIIIDFDKTGRLTPAILLTLAKRCTTPELIELFLKRKDLDEQCLSQLFDKYNNLITEHHLELILENPVTAKIFKHICEHPKANSPKIRPILYQNDLLTPTLLLSLLKQKESYLPNEILFLLNLNTSAVTTEVLERIAELFITTPEVLIAFVTHPEIAPNLIASSLDGDLSSPEVFKKILETTEYEREKINPVLLKEMAKVSLINCSSYPDTIEWQETLELILTRSKDLNISAEMFADIKSKESIAPKLGLKILAILGAPALDKLPLKKMIAQATGTELNLFLNIEVLTKLPEELTRSLFDKCGTDKLLELFLHRPKLSDELLLSIIHEHRLKKEHFLLILEQAQFKDAILEIAFSHPKTTDEIQDKICDHPAFSAENLLNLLDENMSKERFIELIESSNKAINLKVLAKGAMKFSDSLDVLTAIIDNEHSNDPTLLNAIAQMVFKLYNVKKNNEELIANCIIKVLGKLVALKQTEQIEQIIVKNTNCITPKLGLKVIEVLGEEIISGLPLDAIIEQASSDELDKLINLKSLKSNDLAKLASKQLSEPQIDQLLSHKKMTHEIAVNLLGQANYNGRIKDWGWLKTGQLINTLNNTSDFTSFKLALSKLDTKTLTQWLKDIESKQAKYENTANQSQDHRLKLSAAIEKLKIKACFHAVKAMKNADYEKVSQTAFELHQKLANENKKPDLNTSQFLVHINQAKGVLEVHREYKQVLVDILNVLLTAVTAGVKFFTTGDWRFFKTNTDSMNIVNDINKNIADLSNDKGPGAAAGNGG